MQHWPTTVERFTGAALADNYAATKLCQKLTSKNGRHESKAQKRMGGGRRVYISIDICNTYKYTDISVILHIK